MRMVLTVDGSQLKATLFLNPLDLVWTILRRKLTLSVPQTIMYAAKEKTGGG